MSESVNSLKEEALQLLLKESFRHINRMAYEDFSELARKNANIRNINAGFFLFAGEVYPHKDNIGTPVRSNPIAAPPLHYSLFEEYDAIVKRTNSSGMTKLCNYYRAVLSASINGIVLDELLPTILVSSLKHAFTKEQYSLINCGVSDVQSRWQPIEDTRKVIEDIKKHYMDTIIILRNMLMDKFLLSSG